MIGRAGFDVVRSSASEGSPATRAAQRHTGQPRGALWGERRAEFEWSDRTLGQRCSAAVPAATPAFQVERLTFPYPPGTSGLFVLRSPFFTLRSDSY